MTVVEPLHRTLDQQLAALLRGASLECLACGEFVMHARAGVVFCPECGCKAGQRSGAGGNVRGLRRGGGLSAVDGGSRVTGSNRARSRAAGASRRPGLRSCLWP